LDAVAPAEIAAAAKDAGEGATKTLRAKMRLINVTFALQSRQQCSVRAKAVQKFS
jgi:hypothetical protein